MSRPSGTPAQRGRPSCHSPGQGDSCSARTRLTYKQWHLCGWHVVTCTEPRGVLETSFLPVHPVRGPLWSDPGPGTCQGGGQGELDRQAGGRFLCRDASHSHHPRLPETQPEEMSRALRECSAVALPAALLRHWLSDVTWLPPSGLFEEAVSHGHRRPSGASEVRRVYSPRGADDAIL